MRNLYLPAAQTWVYERDGTLVGFVSLLDDDILAAIFVAQRSRAQASARPCSSA